jgi:hypothetical protein
LTIEETLTKLNELKLTSMVLAVRELLETAPGNQLSFEEKLGILVDREWNDRDDRRLARRLKARSSRHGETRRMRNEPTPRLLGGSYDRSSAGNSTVPSGASGSA